MEVWAFELVFAAGRVVKERTTCEFWAACGHGYSRSLTSGLGSQPVGLLEEGWSTMTEWEGREAMALLRAWKSRLRFGKDM